MWLIQRGTVVFVYFDNYANSFRNSKITYLSVLKSLRRIILIKDKKLGNVRHP